MTTQTTDVAAQDEVRCVNCGEEIHLDNEQIRKWIHTDTCCYTCQGPNSVATPFPAQPLPSNVAANRLADSIERELKEDSQDIAT